MILFTFLSLFVYFLFIGERAQTLQGQGGAASGQDGSTLPFLTDHGSHATIRATKFHASTAASVRTEVGFRRGIDDSQTGTEKLFFFLYSIFDSIRNSKKNDSKFEFV